MVSAIKVSLFHTGKNKDYKGGYRLASKIKNKRFDADLYMKH
jgi:hypothetical protein